MNVTGQPAARILVVDDELTVRRLMSVLLSRTGYSVDSAPDGSAALAHIEESGVPALVIVDYMMPVMDGREFLTRARDAGWWFPTILASASLEAPEIAEEMAVEAFLPKPYNTDQLIASVRKVLGSCTKMTA